jgi:anti-anti-sigma factor
MAEFRVIRVECGYALVGELDAATAPRVRELGATLDGFAVDVDLSGLTFVDSSGLHALIELKQAHPRVRLVDPAPQLQRIIALTKTRPYLFDDSP